jgi:hypothetical protein
MAALVLAVVVAFANREPMPGVSRPAPTARAEAAGVAAAHAAAARAVHAVDYAHALLLRERARAEPNLRVQSELWEQAGRAFDEIAAQRDIDAATRKRSVSFW